MANQSSALLGAQPLTHIDAAIRRGLLILSPSELNPIPSQPLGPPRPADAVFETWAPSLHVGASFAIFFVLAFTIARLAVRRFYTGKLGLDDLVIIPAALGVCMYLISVIIQSSAGCLGKHEWDCTYQEINNFFMWAQINDPIFYFSVFTAKLSIALQNRRITYMASKKWQVVHWSFIVLFVTCIPLFTFLEIFKCKPMDINFSLIALGQDPDPKAIVCLDRTALALADRTIHIITDVALLSVPIIIFWRLNMNWRKKARLSALFAIGGMSTIASIVRNVNITKDYTDITWGIHLVYTFDIIDITFAAVVANLPALNAVVDVTWDKLKSYAGYSRQSKSSSNGTNGTRFLAGGRGGSSNPRGAGRSLTSSGSGDHLHPSQSSFVQLYDSKLTAAEERELASMNSRV